MQFFQHFSKLQKHCLLLGLWWLISGALTLFAPLKAEAEYIDEGIEDVYLTLDQALKIALPKAETIETKEIALTPEQKERIEKHAGRPIYSPVMSIYIGKAGERITGYAMVTEEIGLYKPITSMISVTPSGKIRNVSVMVYRESRGGEVQRKRFLSQYRGRTMRNAIRINKDIVNITGATLSVRAMNSQVRKALATINELFI